jgi:hypothetical protein
MWIGRISSKGIWAFGYFLLLHCLLLYVFFGSGTNV